MQDEFKKIVEINGIKIEVDLRNAKVISNFKVGDKVKILIKEYSSYYSYPGSIIGFDNFSMLPTIIVAYLKSEYLTADIKYVYINSETKDIEIVSANPHEISFSKEEIIKKFDCEILSFESKIKETNIKKELFVAQFGKYFNIEDK
jgi:hypothetical protein